MSQPVGHVCLGVSIDQIRTENQWFDRLSWLSRPGGFNLWPFWVSRPCRSPAQAVLALLRQATLSHCLERKTTQPPTNRSRPCRVGRLFPLLLNTHRSFILYSPPSFSCSCYLQPDRLVRRSARSSGSARSSPLVGIPPRLLRLQIGSSPSRPHPWPPHLIPRPSHPDAQLLPRSKVILAFRVVPSTRLVVVRLPPSGVLELTRATAVVRPHRRQLSQLVPLVVAVSAAVLVPVR